jgi:Cu/Ag efflux protein CusF
LARGAPWNFYLQQGTIEPEHRANGDAKGPNVADPFKLQAGLAVSNLKVGDRVTFTSAQVGGVWTVTNIQKQ